MKQILIKISQLHRVCLNYQQLDKKSPNYVAYLKNKQKTLKMQHQNKELEL